MKESILIILDALPLMIWAGFFCWQVGKVRQSLSKLEDGVEDIKGKLKVIEIILNKDGHN